MCCYYIISQPALMRFCKHKTHFGICSATARRSKERHTLLIVEVCSVKNLAAPFQCWIEIYCVLAVEVSGEAVTFL